MRTAILQSQILQNRDDARDQGKEFLFRLCFMIIFIIPSRKEFFIHP